MFDGDIIIPKADHDRAAKERFADFIISWDGDEGALAREIDQAISWGPFELAEARPAFADKDGRMRILCRFYYHGALKQRDYFEHCLQQSLAGVAPFEPIVRQEMTRVKEGVQ